VLGRLVAAACLLTGCDRLFALEHIDELEDGHVGDADARADAADAGPCVVNETFEGNTLGPMWQEYNVSSEATIAVAGGRFAVTPPASISAYNGMFSPVGFNLVDGSVEVELVQALMTGNTDVQFVVQPDFSVSEYFLIFISGGSYIGFRKYTGGTKDETGSSYNGTDDRFLRIRFEGEDVLFETSQSGAADTWTARRRIAAELPRTNLHVMLLAGTYDTAPDVPGTALYDNLKICLAGQH
jgi:hypothetical protein